MTVSKDSIMLRMLASIALALTYSSAAFALPGAELAVRSSGEARGTAWRIEDGYAGTYITVSEPGPVALSVEIGGSTGGVGVVVGDAPARFHVTPAFATHTATFHLPQGTHFVRVQCAGEPGPAVTLRSLNVSGAATANAHTDANAFAAADTYIEHSRKGPATVTLDGVAPGTPVRIELVRHAFNFGGTISGLTGSDVLTPDPAPDSDAAKFQAFIHRNFNTVVPSNGGKWAYNESSDGSVTMGFVDAILDHAETHGMKARMHTMLWAKDQEPAWIKELIDEAVAGDEEARAELRQAIGKRIGYYVRDRAARYLELDVLNESLHQPKYWRIFGAAGVADLYNEAAVAAKGAGNPGLLLCLNEFNVLQWSTDPQTRAADPYANWYRRHAEEVRRAGGAVTAIGVQYYADDRTPPDIKPGDAHSPARIAQAMQNLAVTGLPISITEFGMREGADLGRGAEILEDTLRLAFGAPNATGFVIWGWWAPPGRSAPAALVDTNAGYRLTPMGERWERMMAEWTTRTDAVVADDGAVRFTGFYGDYTITAADRTFTFTHVKAAPDASLASHSTHTP